MKDNFSAQAQAYAQYRPYYPAEMIDYILSFTSDNEIALDVATGNGQVAAALAPHFKKVYATDISQKQIDNATTAPNIYYSISRAEETAFSDNEFDLITVAQAIHWFNFDDFYAQVRRILKPNGLLAILGYGLLSTNKESDKILSHFYKNIIGPYWDAERKYVDDNYTTIPFPFNEIDVKQFTNNFTWTLDQLIGYLNTWSAVQHYKNTNGTNPVDLIYKELQSTWEASNKQVTFPLLLRLGTL